jgi:hypothetical protein
MFSLTQIVLSALGGALVSAVALLAYRRRGAPVGPRRMRDLAVSSVLVGLSILAYRAAANTPAMNDDPMPFVSPNDVLSPVVTYVVLAMYAAIDPANAGTDAPRKRALLTIVSLLVNVVTI